MASTRLTKLQAALLSSAADRKGGNILPLRDQLAGQDKAAGKAITQMLNRGLVSETTCALEAETWRIDGDHKHGLVISAAGHAAIGSNGIPPSMPDELEQPKLEPTCAGFTGSPPRPTKSQMVVDLLWREQGATIAELIAATGWLPHTTRAALTGLRKKGHTIAKGKRDDATGYTIVASEA